MKRKTQAYKELVKVLNFKRQEVSAPSPPPAEKDMWRRLKSELFPEPVKFTFTEGHCYTICDSKAYVVKYKNDVNPAHGRKCIFRYEGMKGIHHCFREARDGWHRTFTNAQLIGKQIKEIAYD